LMPSSVDVSTGFALAEFNPSPEAGGRRRTHFNSGRRCALI
jgi:hypothetical protein